MIFLDYCLSLSTWLPPEQTRPDKLGSGLDARGADWSSCSLGEGDLSDARLCRCDLRGTDLSGCRLDGADLRLARYDSHTRWPDSFDVNNSGAVGPGAHLNGAFLNGTNLRGMDLRGAYVMGAYLSGADLSGAVIDGVSFASSDLRNAILRGCSCRGARFGLCQLDFADFRGANLTDADIAGAESIRGADFSLSHGLEAQVPKLLERGYYELDCWNVLTRQNTREALESLIQIDYSNN